MLRFITVLFGICAVSGLVGLGHFAGVDAAARNWCLVLSALSATLLISSFDAYETERPAARGRDDE